MKKCVKLSHILMGIVLFMFVAWNVSLQYKVDKMETEINEELAYKISHIYGRTDYNIDKIDSLPIGDLFLRIESLENALGFKYDKTHTYDMEKMMEQMKQMMGGGSQR